MDRSWIGYVFLHLFRITLFTHDTHIQVLELREEIEIPHTLKEIGVEEEKISTLAPMAAVDPSSGTNPIELTEQNCSELFDRCINGKL